MENMVTLWKDSLVAVGCVFWFVSCASLSSVAEDSGAEREIRELLSRQVGDWNRGDIESFMTGYVPTERLRFAGASGVQRGYAATLERYRKAYPGKEGMGQLRFSDLEIVRLSRRHAEVFGRYHLTRNRQHGGNATGLFTLLMERQGGEWVIVHDHSSALEPK